LLGVDALLGTPGVGVAASGFAPCLVAGDGVGAPAGCEASGDEPIGAVPRLARAMFLCTAFCQRCFGAPPVATTFSAEEPSAEASAEEGRISPGLEQLDSAGLEHEGDVATGLGIVNGNGG
jgi:hypothetical protein